MTPPEPRPRPRPGPGVPRVPRTVPAPRPGTIVVGDELIRVPGIFAVLRRDPKTRQRASMGAIAAGIALFVAASLTTPVAGANSATGPRPKTAADIARQIAAPLLEIDPTAPSVHKVLHRKPTHVATQAPVDHGVISGLAANGIPRVAMNAYRVAAARMANVEPGCGIDWALLAGIGREESDHGRFAGAVLRSDGISTPSIIGPALDGIHWDYIPAPGNGLALDGDAKFAHALGPMQFIPSTWAGYGADATGDGKADIFNINDAALGAARYLCAAGGNLRTHAGQVAAVLAYNHNDQYLAQVLALADAYRRGIKVTGIPVGITSGPLPKVVDTGYIPPANPGAPTAVGKQSSGTNKSPTPAKSSAAPKPGSGSSSTPTKSSAPSSPPTKSGTTSSPKPSPTKSTTPAPSPSPTPTTTCNPVQVLLGCK
jgi:membrane-bound lytic murein transglycosylase B